jgi:K+-sensing histidine kinase KdpD
LKNKNILVCITQQKTCERLIQKAAELNGEYGGTLHVIHVVKNDVNFLNNDKEGEALEYLFGISKSVGANLAVLKSDSVAGSIAEYALNNSVGCLIIGESPKDQAENKFCNNLKKLLDNVEIRVIP